MFYVDLLVPQTFQENEKRVCLYLDYTNRHYLKLSSNFFPFTSLSLSTGCAPSFLHISLIIYYRTAVWSDPFSCVTLSRFDTLVECIQSLFWSLQIFHPWLGVFKKFQVCRFLYSIYELLVLTPHTSFRSSPNIPPLHIQRLQTVQF